MKKSKMMNRLAAMALAGTILAAMGTNAFAADTSQSLTAVTLTKTVKADDNVKAPNTSFGFSVSPAGEVKDSNGVIKAYAGVNGGMKFAEGKDVITFTPGDTSLSKTTEISLDISKFSTPGIYHYTVSENTGSYDGMTYDSKKYDAYVYVENDEDNGLKISAVESKLNGTKSALSFENTYATNKLTLKKVIAGNQSNRNKEFKFTLRIDGATGEQYTAMNGNDTQTLTSGTSVTYELGNEETVVIYGLSADDTYTIVEEDCSNDGYVTTISVDGTIDETNRLQVSGKEGTADKAVTYTNKKDVSTPTGIVANGLPYAVMVACAGGIAVVFLRKREYEG